MFKKLTDFAQSVCLPVSEEQAKLLVAYAERVWQKKDFLNLTSAADLQEVLSRHICDGLAGAAKVYAMSRVKGLETFTLADVGSGAG